MQFTTGQVGFSTVGPIGYKPNVADGVPERRVNPVHGAFISPSNYVAGKKLHRHSGDGALAVLGGPEAQYVSKGNRKLASDLLAVPLDLSKGAFQVVKEWVGMLGAPSAALALAFKPTARAASPLATFGASAVAVPYTDFVVNGTDAWDGDVVHPVATPDGDRVSGGIVRLLCLAGRVSFRFVVRHGRTIPRWYARGKA